jgi:hypothetical protein
LTTPATHLSGSFFEGCEPLRVMSNVGVLAATAAAHAARRSEYLF